MVASEPRLAIASALLVLSLVFRRSGVIRAFTVLPMIHAAFNSLELAGELIALEDAGGKNWGSTASERANAIRVDPAVNVCKQLQAVLTAFAGAEGFRSLLTRALTVAKTQEPLLLTVSIREDGSVAGLETSSAPSGEAQKKKTRYESKGVHLVAELLDLLVIFVGQSLTIQLVRSAWPDARPGEIRMRIEDQP